MRDTSLGGDAVIRPMRPADVPLLTAIFERTVPQVYAGIVSEDAVRDLINDAAEALRGTWPLAVVADAGGKVAGVALVKDENHLSMLWLDEDARGAGLGSRLLAYAKDSVRIAGHKGMSLAVYAGNVRAVRFYKHRGWRTMSRAQGRFGADVLGMEKIL